MKISAIQLKKGLPFISRFSHWHNIEKQYCITWKSVDLSQILISYRDGANSVNTLVTWLVCTSYSMFLWTQYTVCALAVYIDLAVCSAPLSFAVTQLHIPSLRSLYLLFPLVRPLYKQPNHGRSQQKHSWRARISKHTETIMYCNHTSVPYSFYRHTQWSGMINHMPETGREDQWAQ